VVVKKAKVLKPGIDGRYFLKSEAQVKQALKKMEDLAVEIAELESKHGIIDKRHDALQLKTAAQNFMLEKELDAIELDDGRYARIVRSYTDRHWVLTKDDLPENTAIPSGFKSLRQILSKKFGAKSAIFKSVWMTATKRVADPMGIQELVREGRVSEEELAPAYIERERAPFLRIFGEKL
jgi:hypothetical protein